MNYLLRMTSVVSINEGPANDVLAQLNSKWSFDLQNSFGLLVSFELVPSRNLGCSCKINSYKVHNFYLLF